MNGIPVISVDIETYNFVKFINNNRLNLNGRSFGVKGIHDTNLISNLWFILYFP